MKVKCYDLSPYKTKEDLDYAIQRFRKYKRDEKRHFRFVSIYSVACAGCFTGYIIKQMYLMSLTYLVYTMIGTLITFKMYQTLTETTEFLMLLEDEYSRYIR